MSDHYSCSIVIRCYNEEKHIARLLEGIVQQSIKNIEIIIVDSGSTDATLSIASRYPTKIISLQPKEFSFGRALNLGCKNSSGELLVFASAHVYPLCKDWLEHLLAPFSDNKVALVYGKQRGNEVSKYSEHQIFEKWFPDLPYQSNDHPFCNNANIAIRKSLWQENPYDESLTGLEDLAWANKIISQGYKTIYVPEAEVIHVHDEPFRNIFNRYKREAIALKTIFPREKFSFLDFVRLFLGNSISDFYHSIRDRKFFSQFLGILCFRWNQFWGTYRGFCFRQSVSYQLKKTFYYPKGFKRVRGQGSFAAERYIDYDMEGTNCNENN